MIKQQSNVMKDANGETAESKNNAAITEALYAAYNTWCHFKPVTALPYVRFLRLGMYEASVIVQL